MPVFVFLLLCGAVRAQTPRYDRPIHRTDLFVAARYQQDSVLIFFSNEGTAEGLPAMGRAMGRAIGQVTGQVTGQAVPHPMSAAQTRLLPPRSRLSGARTDAEKSLWYADWPVNGAPAPRLGDHFRIQIGGVRTVQATLRTLAFLPACYSTWLVGIATVAAQDQPLYRASATSAAAGPWGGFLASKAPVAAGSTKNGATAETAGSKTAESLLGPVLSSTAKDFPLSAADRAKVERALNNNLATNYATLLTSRQQIYQHSNPSPLVQVQGSSALLQGKAKLVYLVQKVVVAPGTASQGVVRYYVRAQWRSQGQALYFIHAWFTPDFALSFTSDSGVPAGSGQVAALDAPGHHAGRILNIFVDQITDELGRRRVVHRLLMEQSDTGSKSYVVMQWSPGALLPIGTYFGSGC